MKLDSGIETEAILVQKNKLLKILIVDDNLDMTEVLCKILSMKNHDCTTSNSGEEAIELVKNTQYDLMLLDLSMPGFSGIDVFDSLVNEGLITKQKIVFLTATDLESNQINEMKKKGLSGVITKPIKIDKIFEIINQIINH